MFKYYSEAFKTWCYPSHFVDLAHIWLGGREWSKILYSTIFTTDLEIVRQLSQFTGQSSTKQQRVYFREATLRRHNEMEHEDKDDDDEEFDDDEMDDDKDMEYKPSIAEIKKEVEEAREETEDMPPLTAEEMAEVVPSEGMDEGETSNG